MRYIHVQDIVVDSQLPLIIIEGNEISLEPKQHALLLLFIEHANQVVSRDQIINEVNQGIIVSDNAVNKMVANLRQLLKDNPKSPQFIKTIPKQGYCFIASCARQESLVTSGQKTDRPAASPLSLMVISLSAIFIVGLAIWLMLSTTSEPKTFSSMQLQPLTRHSGVEFSPVVSPDKQLLAYTRNDPHNDIAQLWIRHLDGSEKETLVQDIVISSEMTWSSDSKQLVFTDYPKQTCQLLRFTVGHSSEQVESMGKCDALYVSHLQFVEDDNAIIYTARQVGFDPIQIYRYSLSDKSRVLIKQPDPTGSGNYGFDISSDGNKMLILSADEGSCHTSMYVLNLITNTLENKGRWSRFINRAIWHHDGESVINTTNEYSHEIVQSRLDGTMISTMVSTSNRVADNFSRFPNGRDYYFTSFQMNNDNELINIDDGSVKRTFNSAVYDKIPTFAHKSNQWFFLSKRNGPSQIFLGDETTKQLQQITHYETEPQISDLDVSPDGKTLLIGGRKQIELITLANNAVETINVEEGFAISTGWLSDNRLAVSILVNGQPQLRYYHLDAKSFSKANERWQGAFNDSKGNRLFFVEQGTKEIYQWFEEEEVARTTNVKLEWAFGNGVDAKIDGDTLIYRKQNGAESEMFARSLTSGEERSLGKWFYIAGFDFADNQLLVSFEQGRSGDILKTDFQ